MMFRKILLFLVLVTTTYIGAAMAKNTYIIHMDKTKMAAKLFHEGDSMQTYQAVIDSINEMSLQKVDGDQQQETMPAELLYAYETAISGFSAKLSTKQLQTLEKVDGFLSATPDQMLQLHTTNSQQFLGLQNGKGLLSASNLASDVIIGIVDTGIWPEHASFQDKGMPAVPSRWKGVCEEGTKFSKSNCNKKLIGARYFFKGYEVKYGRINETEEILSARDNDGHGTHTASTAAGSLVANASFFGLAPGVARGTSYTSRIAVYKVCWRFDCTTSDMLAAIDKAVQDGVDVLSMSLGLGPLPFHSDPLAIGSFGAIKSGVFVSSSAGNEGYFSSYLSNSAPWMMTVAASYIDRTFPAIIKLGNGKVVEGVSLNSGDALTKPVPVAYLESAIFCNDGTLNESLVKGKIVVCHRGNGSSYVKSENVKKAKGVGMILINLKLEGDELTAAPYKLPTARVGYTAGKFVRQYASTVKKPTASIIFKGTVYGRTAPVIAAFSSRGPNSVDPNVIKPDVTAPGVNILAAWPPIASPSGYQDDTRSVLFNILSGTSMSCPHVSGLAALLKSVHRDWSPAAIKSALMTTAYTLNNKRSPISDVVSSNSAGPFAYGSGHVDPERAVDPGLIYDIAAEDYLKYLCSLNYTSNDIALFTGGIFTCPQNIAFRAGDLNYPSFAFNFKGGVQNGSLEYKRTVTNVGTPTSSYAVQVEVPNGVSVIVKPKILSFSKLGQKLSYKVTVVVGKSKTSSDSSFGSLTWVSRKFRVRSPIAVTWQ